jgi:hypothetical protein
MATSRIGTLNNGFAASNKLLQRTRHERASLLSCVGEPLKRSVRRLVVRVHRRDYEDTDS